MKQNNVTPLNEMLTQMTTQQLDEMLMVELRKERIDDNAFHLIMRVLKDRESNYQNEITPEVERAWEKYQRNISHIEKNRARIRKIKNWVLRATSVAAVLCLIILTFHQYAVADTFLERLSRWTDSIVEFFGQKDDEARIEKYEFKTDNLGLLQVYDVVLEIGVTDPVVPMWLPDGFELTECKKTESPRRAGVRATFDNNGTEAIIVINNHADDKSHSYYKDGDTLCNYEQNGTTFYIFQNGKRWVAVWVKDKIECSISLDCQENTLYRILRSIYTMEEYK